MSVANGTLGGLSTKKLTLKGSNKPIILLLTRIIARPLCPPAKQAKRKKTVAFAMIRSDLAQHRPMSFAVGSAICYLASLVPHGLGDIGFRGY